MRETEITVQVHLPPAALREALLRRGFAQAEQFLLLDRYFCTGDRALAESLDYGELLRRSLLLRTIRAEAETSILCYKDKAIDENGVVVSEEKTSTPVADPETAAAILRKAGLFCWCELTDSSQVLRRGETALVLQAVEGLGVFLEYEEEAGMADWEPYEKLRHMKGLLLSLGLPLGEDFSCRKPYLKWKQITGTAAS